MARLLDPKKDGRYPFEYRTAAQTDLAATFKRIRAEQRRNQQERTNKVAPMKRRTAP